MGHFFAQIRIHTMPVTGNGVQAGAVVGAPCWPNCRGSFWLDLFPNGSICRLFAGIIAPMRRFIFIFIVLQLVLFGIELTQLVQQHLVLPWTTLLAQACVAIVTGFDANAAAMGKVLWNPATGFGVSIEPGCNGVEACIILFAAIVAFPSTWKHRAWGLGLGFVAVQALNVVRVISLFYLGQWNDTAFKIAHEYLWQGLIMLDVLVVWLLWVRANPDLSADAGTGTATPAAA